LLNEIAFDKKTFHTRVTMNPKPPNLSIDMKKPNDPTRTSPIQLEEKDTGVNYSPIQGYATVRKPSSGQVGYGPNNKKLSS